jgi:hypothetical protein
MPSPKFSLDPEAVAEARARFERGEPLNRIAKSMGTHNTTLRRLRDAQEWTVQVPVQDVAHFDSTIQRRTQAEVIELAARRGIEHAEASGLVEKHADLLEDAFTLSGALIADFGKGASETVADWRAGRIEIPKTQTAVDLALAVGGVVAKYASMVREAAGRKPGQATVEQVTDVNAPVRIDQRRLETVRIPVDERGRKLDQEAN